MLLDITRFDDGYRVEHRPDDGPAWAPAEALTPSQVLQELTARGCSRAEINAAMDRADREAARRRRGQASWTDLYMTELRRAEPVDGVTPVTPGWRSVSVGFEGDSLDIGGGVNPWRHEWLSTYRFIVVAHPTYPRQRHAAEVYRMGAAGPEMTFAATELSNGVWGFWVPEAHDR